ncbi:F-box/kelch-repeat protein At3g23880-like [Lycium ferocissimum]|uniref:F-box/kelch-repeat protein At3g23880-like n=1 Tax=Lycium ferocissimum TaxID=112874 RepID=UPI002814984B|nr:F-box/kelch-repeat protein At3g23880-like [Lycium ferocissimum]
MGLQFALLLRWAVSSQDCTYGFGYDATSDDYKILKIDGNSPHGDKVPYEIFTLKSGSWRNIGNHPTGNLFVSPHMEPRMVSLAFVHGAFQWLGLSECIAMSDSGFTVVSFGVSNEVYGEIPLLERMCYVSNSMSDRLVISVLGGCFAFILLIILMGRSGRYIGLGMVKCYCAADFGFVMVLYLGHPKDHLDHGLKVMVMPIPLRKDLRIQKA